MKILLLVETLTLGGLPNYVLELARALRHAGDTVALLHLDAEAPDHLDFKEVNLLSVDAEQPLAPQISALLQGWQPDLVHIHLCSQQEALNALMDSGIPVIRSYHDYTSMCLRRGRRRFPGDRCQRALGLSCALFGCLIGPPASPGGAPRLMDLRGKLQERQTYQQCAASIVGSQHMRRVLLTNGFSDNATHVIPYFSRFHAQAEGLTPMPDKPSGAPGVERPVSLLFSGQAVAGKGLAVLVQALASLRGDWQLVAITTGPELAKVQALATALKLQDRITFVSWLPQEQLASYYRNADLLVLPSIWDDPGPLVGIEAMSFETPVVAFAVGGIPDYVIPGRTGWLAGAVSPQALGQILQQAISSPETILQRGRASRQLIAERHTQHAHLQSMRSIYQQVCASTSVPTQEATWAGT